MDKGVGLAIKVTSDARGAAAGLDSATGKVNRLGRAGQVAGRLLAAGLLVAAGAAIKFTNAAADDAQASAKLASTAQKVAGATKAQTAGLEDWITAQGKSKGVTDDELRPALEKLITVTHNVGKARRLASLAEDISARSGKSLESVTQALAKAQTGSVAGLAKYQVQTKDAEGKTRSLAAVQKDLAKAYKGAAADSADTAAGKAKILSVQMGELQEKIGTQLIPVMQKLTTEGLKVVDWISKNTKATEIIVGVLLSFLAVIKVISVLTKAFTAIQAALNVVMSANPVVLVVLAVIALAAAFVIAYKRSETFRNIVNTAFAGISKVVSAVVDFIRDHWKALLIILGGPVGLAVVLIASHFDKVKAVVGAVVGWVKDHWPAIKAILVAAFSEAKDKISTIIDAVSKVIKAVKGAVEDAAAGVKAAVQTIIDIWQAAINKVQAFIDKVNSIPHGGAHGRVGQLGPDGQPTGGQSQPVDRLAARGGVHVHLHLDGPTLVGNDMDVARKLEEILNANARRFRGALAVAV